MTSASSQPSHKSIASKYSQVCTFSMAVLPPCTWFSKFSFIAHLHSSVCFEASTRALCPAAITSTRDVGVMPAKNYRDNRVPRKCHLIDPASDRSKTRLVDIMLAIQQPTTGVVTDVMT